MSATTNLGAILVVSEQDAQKVITYNEAFGVLDRAIAGYLPLSVAGAADVTLDNQASTIPGTQALNQTYTFTGALTGNINVKFPATGGSARQFTVFNNTTGAFTLTVKTTAVGSTGIAVTQGKKRLLWTDGTNVYDAITDSGLPGGGDALIANPLSQFANTTSAQLASIITDETGSGALVFATSPTLVTPTLGVAAATSLTVADEAYGVGWNGSLQVPTKNALYDKIETLAGGGANTALSNLAAVSINTHLLPGSDGGPYLGSATLRWAGLHLVEGSAINWDNGDVTLTQTGNSLAVAGGDFITPVIAGGVAANDDLTIHGTSHATKATSYVWIQPSGGNVGIGSAPAPSFLFTVSTNAAAIPANASPGETWIADFAMVDGTPGGIGVDSFGGATNFGSFSVIDLRRARGTAAAPTALQSGDLIGVIGALGYGATGYSLGAAQIRFYANQNWSDTAHGSAIAFLCTANDSASSTVGEVFRITDAGNLKIGGTAIRSGTRGTRHLDVFDGTAPTGTLTNGISYYSESGQPIVMNAAGNAHKVTAVEIGLAVSDETTALTTGTAKLTFRMPYAMTLTGVRANVNTAPTGSTLIVDINEGGVTILSTKLSIDASELTSQTAATPAVISDSALADDAEITIDIDQVGSTIAGKGLKVWILGYKT